jgi:hypothetical protein
MQQQQESNMSISVARKVTTGYVIQNFNVETGKCVSQEFIAGDEANWEDIEGNPIDDINEEMDEVEYCPFHMVDPLWIVENDTLFKFDVGDTAFYMTDNKICSGKIRARVRIDNMEDHSGDSARPEGKARVTYYTAHGPFNEDQIFETKKEVADSLLGESPY